MACYSNSCRINVSQNIRVVENVWPSVLYIQHLHPDLFEPPLYREYHLVDEKKLEKLFSQSDKLKEEPKKVDVMEPGRFSNPPKWATTAPRFYKIWLKSQATGCRNTNN